MSVNGAKLPCAELPGRPGVDPSRPAAFRQERPMREKTQLDLELSPQIHSLPELAKAESALDRALAEAGIPRTEVFVTNAVKHFKHEMRGKRRLHKRPNAYEIERCKIWLDLERALVKPAAIVALGATAARSLLGRPVTIGKLRGQTLHLADGTAAFVTIHPSFLLRIEDDVDKQREYENFVADLRPAARALRKAVA